jgi:hypothetical protein
MRTSPRLLRQLVVGTVVFLAAASAQAAAGVTPSDATPVQREEAQTHFAKGRDLYTAKRFDEAAAEFERSYAIVASPNALFFLARCDRERGKLVAAYAELGRTAAEAREHASEDPRYAKTAQAASDERDAIAAQLGFVTVNVTGGSAETTVTVAGTKFPRAALGEPLPIAAGSTEVVVETPGSAPVRQSVAVFAGEKKSVTIDAGTASAPAVAEPPRATPAAPLHADSGEDAAAGRARLRTVSYVSAGVAVVGLATFAVAGTLSNSAYSDLQAKCHGPCPSDGGSGTRDEIDRGKTEQTLANVGLVVGLVGAAAAVTFFVMSLPGKSDKVSLTVGPSWLGVKGEF